MRPVVPSLFPLFKRSSECLKKDQNPNKEKPNTHPQISPKHLSLTLPHSKYPVEGSYTDEVEELGGPSEFWLQLLPQCHRNIFLPQCRDVLCSQQTGQALSPLLPTRNSIWSQETSPSKYDVLPKKVSFVQLPGSNRKSILSKKHQSLTVTAQGFFLRLSLYILPTQNSERFAERLN